MQAEYWQKAWTEERIGFHQQRVNKRLQNYWSSLPLAAGSVVFVPLCGKSLDMLWLHEQGFQVFGVELSDKAIKAFFVENGLPYEHEQRGNFSVFSGTGIAQGIELRAGNFFDLTAADLADCTAFYDRAALIAMGDDMRADYTAHMAALMPAGSHGLLLSIGYDQSRMKGPPFSVPHDIVHELLTDSFHIQELAHYSGPKRLGNLAERGLETLEEWVYLLKRNP